jgi:membrane associated rhomboid family serine protease
MIILRIGTEEIRLEPEEWELWIQDGRISPDASVWIAGTGWVPVATLPDYRGLREAEAKPSPRVPEVFSIVFPRRGLSATEAFGLTNLLAAGILTAILGANYLAGISDWATQAWFGVRDRHAYWFWLPTLFLHAGPKHLFGNMISLVATGGAVEYLMGRRWVYALYFMTGIAGMWLSFEGHGHPPLSIGASGAIFGLGGATVAFVLRRHRSFTYGQRWKARRVYAPLFLFLIVPSVLNADYLGHLGGLIAGLCAGLFVPPHPRLHLGEKEKAPSEEGALQEPGTRNN